MSQGWIKLHRKIQDHWLYEEKRKFSKYEAWIDMLLMANHKDNKFVFGNELVEVKKGSFITSELKLMEKWSWGKSKLRSFLELLEKDGMIVKKTDRKKTTITICNYCIYHDSETENRPQSDHEQTTDRLSADTNKNVKNVKNEKKVVVDGDPIDQIADYFMVRRGKAGQAPRATDYRDIKAVFEAGVTVEQALEGVDKAFDDFTPNYPGDGIGAFAYCKKVILTEYHRQQSREEAQHAPINRTGNGQAPRKDSITGGKTGWLPSSRKRA